MQRAGVWGLQHDPFYSSNPHPKPKPNTYTLTLTPTLSLSSTLTLTLSLTGPLLLLARLGRVHGAPLLSSQDARLSRGGRWVRVVR